MTSTPQSPPPTDPIQFDRAEYATPDAPTQTCAACGRTPDGAYYTANNQVICPTCRDAFLASTTGGSRVARFTRALLFGVGAGLAGAALWFAVRKITGYEIGLIAILVGVMVGLAVRKGSNHRGGFGYQFLAVALTYSCIAGQYVPDVFQSLRENFDERTNSAGVERGTPATTAPTTMAASASNADPAAAASASAPSADEDAKAADEFRQMSAAKKVGLLLLFGAILFAIALAAPFLAGLENIIGLLIIAFALWEAWKLNRRNAVAFTGPHTLAPPPPAAPPAPPLSAPGA